MSEREKQYFLATKAPQNFKVSTKKTLVKNRNLLLLNCIELLDKVLWGKKENIILDKILIKKLKKQAHHLKAELNLGKDGLSKLWMKSLREAFQTKELIKVKILDNSPQNCDEIKNRLHGIPDIFHIQTVGNILTLYKEIEPTGKSELQ